MKHFLILSFVIISVGANAQKFRQEIQDYNSVVNLRNETLAPKKNDKAFIQTTKHLYSYDSADNTSTDDGLNTIIQTSGSKRWKCLNCHLRVELSQDSILLQYDANDILVQRDTIRLTGGGPDKFHSNIVGTAPYDPLNPLTGWVAPTSPIAGNTVEVKFTDGTIGNYTFDGSAWVQNFPEAWHEKRICLNTASPTFTPVDPNNPTITEVEAWKNTNLSLLDQTNGTQLVYFVVGDGGSCDNPDFTWTLNKGSELITLSNKRVYDSNTIYVDTQKGSNVTGLRGYVENPFKNFTNALAVYQNNDWIKYGNTNENINGVNIAPAATTHYYDFGDGNITVNAGGNAFIGNHNTIDLEERKVNVVSRGLLSINKAFYFNRNGDINIDANIVNTSQFLIVSKSNANINIKKLIGTNVNYPVGFFSGSDKSIAINIDDVIINKNTSTPAFSAGIVAIETREENTVNLKANINFKNVVLNSVNGMVLTLTPQSGFSLINTKVGLNIGNLQNISPTYDPITNNQYVFSLFLFTTNANANFENCFFNYNIDNIESDLSLISNINTCTFINTNYNFNIRGKCVINKGYILKQTGIETLDNSKFTFTGDYFHTNSTIEPILINNLTLINGSEILFDGNFKAGSNISLQGINLDATSKIVFKGKYDLGNGYFDISGVTGAGADNIYFEDCTIITNNAECIVSGTAKNIKVLNVRSNKIVNSNITELIQSITVNSTIN